MRKKIKKSKCSINTNKKSAKKGWFPLNVTTNGMQGTVLFNGHWPFTGDGGGGREVNPKPLLNFFLSIQMEGKMLSLSPPVSMSMSG